MVYFNTMLYVKFDCAGMWLTWSITLSIDSREYTKEMKDIFPEYNSHSIDTHTGKHGKPAQL